jgi:hypothetical protein
MGAPDKAAPCVLAAEIGLFLDIKVPISIGSGPHCETQILCRPVCFARFDAFDCALRA